MKKIFFNDNYCLTQAVIDGSKTMTRRVLRDNVPLGNWEEIVKHLPYKVGEVVAIAQSYNDIYNELEEQGDDVSNDWWLPSFEGKVLDTLAGYKNKMFVRSDFMKHHIKITDVKVERLHDISDDDIMQEGIYPQRFFNKVEYVFATKGKMNNTPVRRLKTFPTPREAFAALIDKISGKGTWENNPLVVAYSFELIKSK